jgi:hypothetical protein
MIGLQNSFKDIFLKYIYLLKNFKAKMDNILPNALSIKVSN